MTAAALSYVIMNRSSTSTLASQVPAFLPALEQALTESLGGVFSTYWGGVAYFRLASSDTDRKDGEIAIHVIDSEPSEPDAIAWHWVVGGVPDIVVALDMVDTLSTGSDSLSVAMDHECKENQQDLGCNGWIDMGQGYESAREVCDRVEDTTYKASNGVALSNFLLPSAWIPGAVGPFDFVGVLTSQTQITQGGYDMERAGVGDQGQDVTGPRGKLLALGPKGVRMVSPGELSHKRRARKASRFSRTRRRGIVLPYLPTSHA